MKLRILAAALAAAVLLSGCANEIGETVVSRETEPTEIYDLPPEQPAYPVSVGGETFDSAPASVASLSPSLTEILCELGASDRLSAVGDYCDWPSETEALPKLGSPAKPDLEAIKAAAPELLITQSPLASTEELTLEQAGIKVLTLDAPSTYAELCEDYIQLAEILFGAVDGQNIAFSALSGLDSAMNAALGLGASKSFVIVEAESGDGLMLSPGGTLCSDMLSVFGENLFGGEKGYYASPEVLYILAPDIIFMADGVDRDEVREHFPTAEIIKIDFERFERPSGRLAEVINGCAAALG